MPNHTLVLSLDYEKCMNIFVGQQKIIHFTLQTLAQQPEIESLIVMIGNPTLHSDELKFKYLNAYNNFLPFLRDNLRQSFYNKTISKLPNIFFDLFLTYEIIDLNEQEKHVAQAFFCYDAAQGDIDNYSFHKKKFFIYTSLHHIASQLNQTEFSFLFFSSHKQDLSLLNSFFHQEHHLIPNTACLSLLSPDTDFDKTSASEIHIGSGSTFQYYYHLIQQLIPIVHINEFIASYSSELLDSHHTWNLIPIETRLGLPALNLPNLMLLRPSSILGYEDITDKFPNIISTEKELLSILDDIEFKLLNILQTNISTVEKFYIPQLKLFISYKKFQELFKKTLQFQKLVTFISTQSTLQSYMQVRKELEDMKSSYPTSIQNIAEEFAILHCEFELKKIELELCHNFTRGKIFKQLSNTIKEDLKPLFEQSMRLLNAQKHRPLFFKPKAKKLQDMLPNLGNK
jgi:hypothetical protein